MKTTPIVIGIILIVVVGGIVYWQKNVDMGITPTPNVENTKSNTESTTSTGTESTNPNTNTGKTTGNTEGTITEKPSAIPMTEVATHNSRTSCWSAINGNVYNLTSWIPKHPGGEEAILKLCGRDGSEKFNDKHGGAVQQATVLAGFKIGTLAL